MDTKTCVDGVLGRAPRGVLQIPVCYLHYVDFPERESIHHVDFQELQPSQSSYAGP